MTTSSSAPSGDLTIQILQALDSQSPLLSVEAFPTVAFQEIKAALDRLASRSMITYETIDREEAILEPEAQQIAEHGSHEARVFEALRSAVEGLTIQELEKAIGDKTVTKAGQGKAFKEKWISKSKDGKLVATVSVWELRRETLFPLTSGIGRIDRGCHSSTTPKDQGNPNTRAQGHHRIEEAKVDQVAKGH